MSNEQLFEEKPPASPTPTPETQPPADASPTKSPQVEQAKHGAIELDFMGRVFYFYKEDFNNNESYELLDKKSIELKNIHAEFIEKADTNKTETVDIKITDEMRGKIMEYYGKHVQIMLKYHFNRFLKYLGSEAKNRFITAFYLHTDDVPPIIIDDVVIKMLNSLRDKSVDTFNVEIEYQNLVESDRTFMGNILFFGEMKEKEKIIQDNHRALYDVLKQNIKNNTTKKFQIFQKKEEEERNIIENERLRNLNLPKREVIFDPDFDSFFSKITETEVKLKDFIKLYGDFKDESKQDLFNYRKTKQTQKLRRELGRTKDLIFNNDDFRLKNLKHFIYTLKLYSDTETKSRERLQSYGKNNDIIGLLKLTEDLIHFTYYQTHDLMKFDFQLDILKQAYTIIIKYIEDNELYSKFNETLNYLMNEFTTNIKHEHSEGLKTHYETIFNINASIRAKYEFIKQRRDDKQIHDLEDILISEIIQHYRSILKNLSELYNINNLTYVKDYHTKYKKFPSVIIDDYVLNIIESKAHVYTDTMFKYGKELVYWNNGQ